MEIPNQETSRCRIVPPTAPPRPLRALIWTFALALVLIWVLKVVLQSYCESENIQYYSCMIVFVVEMKKNAHIADENLEVYTQIYPATNCTPGCWKIVSMVYEGTLQRSGGVYASLLFGVFGVMGRETLNGFVNLCDCYDERSLVALGSTIHAVVYAYTLMG